MPALNLGVTLPGTGYKNISDFVVTNIFANLPYTTGLVGSYFLSSQTLSPLINYANLNLSLSRVGSPTVGTKYATTSPTSYFDTGLPSTSNMTILAISYPITGEAAGDVIVSNMFRDSSNNARGDLLRANSDGLSTNITVYGDYNTTSPTSAIVNALPVNSPIGDPLISCGIILNATGTGNSTIATYLNVQDGAGVTYPQTPAATNSNDVETAHLISPNNTLLIGSSRSSADFSGSSQVSVVLIFNNNAVSGLINNALWLKETFGVTYGLWSS